MVLQSNHLLRNILATIFLGWALLMFMLPFIFIISIFFFPKMKYIMFLYLIWLYCDRKTPSQKGRKVRHHIIQNNFLSSHVRDYFPIKLIKTADLPVGNNYLLTSFPHGSLPISAFINFFRNTNEIDKIFPGIDMRAAVYEPLLYFPLFREALMAFGSHTSSQSSIKYLLSSEPSKGLLLTPGGIAEMRYCKLDRQYIILKNKRKGFVRLALMTGAPLVPVFTFGEINTYTTHKIIPRILPSRFHVPELYFLNGRGFLQQRFGLLPRKHPLTTVVGAPIQVPKIENPPKELIDEYHEKFFKALHDLFETYKHEYDNVGGKSELIML